MLEILASFWGLVVANAGVIVGAGMPILVDLVGQYVPNSKGRFWVALVLSFVAAFLLSLSQGSLGGVDLFADFGVIFGLSQVVYKQFWEKSIPREGYLMLIGDMARAIKLKRERTKLLGE